MNRQGYIFFLASFFSVLFLNAQENGQMKWHDPSKGDFRTVHNQLWHGSEIACYYDRLPAKAENEVRKEVWNLSRNAAGLKLVFTTDAAEITVRYVALKKNYAMDHFPATGVSGIDLFATNDDGTWTWANGSYSFKDTITYTYSGLDLDRDRYRNRREFHLYLPLYNTVEWLEIGVPSASSFTFVPVADEKPVIVYGTSIAQGGCASRAGMAWTNVLERAIHIPVVNLGFSGNGRLEKGVIDLIAANDARIFVLDCLPNLSGEIEAIVSKTREAVRTISARHPQTPIILVEHSGYLENRMNTEVVKRIRSVNDESLKAYKALKSEGVENLYYLKYEDIGLNQYDSVDGVHPTDGGMLKYAQAYAKLIQEILNK